MSMYRHRDETPRIGVHTRIASNATIVGDVHISEGCSVGYNAVIVAESGPVRIGAGCVIMDGAVLRGTRKDPLVVGDPVLIRPHASLVGCTIEDDVFAATNAVIFNAARVGARSEIQIDGIVHLRTRLVEDTVVPLGWLAVGDPATIRPPSAHDEIWAIQKERDFPGYVFGAARPAAGEPLCPKSRRLMLRLFAAGMLKIYRSKHLRVGHELTRSRVCRSKPCSQAVLLTAAGRTIQREVSPPLSAP